MNFNVPSVTSKVKSNCNVVNKNKYDVDLIPLFIKIHFQLKFLNKYKKISTSFIECDLFRWLLNTKSFNFRN